MRALSFSRKDLVPIVDCYAVCPIKAGGRRYYIYASDNKGPCYAIDPQTGGTSVVWDGPGGTMSIVPIPGTDGEFLISQRFFPGFAAREARIMRVSPAAERKWKVTLWMDMPYVHRFDILQRGDRYYFLGCILSSTKEDHADWQMPGYIIGASLPANFDPPSAFDIIADGMSRNHGYWRRNYKNHTTAFTACDQGVFSVIPPGGGSDGWQIHKILDRSTSDIAFCDIDNDGQDEMAAIHPFHGDQYVVYHEEPAGYREIYRYPDPMEFIHVVWGGTLGGRKVFLGGCRSLNKELFALYWDKNGMVTQILDKGSGPSNVAVEYHEDGDHLLVANHGAGISSVFSVPGLRGPCASV
jgi:hypothetical protein